MGRDNIIFLVKFWDIGVIFDKGRRVCLIWYFLVWIIVECYFCLFKIEV